jgi:hypothetical protein
MDGGCDAWKFPSSYLTYFRDGDPEGSKDLIVRAISPTPRVLKPGTL